MMNSRVTIGLMLDDIRDQLTLAKVPDDLARYAVVHAREELSALGYYLDQRIQPGEYETTATTVLAWVHSSLAHKRAAASLEHDEDRLTACDDAASAAANWRMIYA